MKVRIVITVIIGLLSNSIVYADEAATTFLQRSQEGWFFYNEIIEEEVPEEEEKEAPPPLAAAPPPPEAKGPAPLSAEWMKANLPRYLNMAIDDPSPENVTAYLYLQKYAMNKASAFRETFQTVSFSDPYLDENSARPIPTNSGRLSDRISDQSKTTELKKLAKTTGLWFFYHSECRFCAQQVSGLKAIARLYDFHITAISLDGRPLPGGHFPDFKVDSGQAGKLNVTRTPTLILVRPPNDYALIASGVITANEFAERTIMLAKQEGWIDEDDYQQTRRLKFDRPEPEDLTPLQKLHGEDFTPTAPDIIDYFKQRVTGSF